MAWDVGVEVAKCRVVLVHLVRKLADALLDDVVCLLFVAQHHLHEVELTLHKATRAHI